MTLSRSIRAESHVIAAIAFVGDDKKLIAAVRHLKEALHAIQSVRMVEIRRQELRKDPKVIVLEA